MKYLHQLYVLAIAILFLTPYSSSVTANETKSASAHQERRVRYLVDRLASTNSPPGNDQVGVPSNYDKQAQVVVYLAVQQLLREGAASFDALLQHLNDARYSYTVELPGEQFNRTVGASCKLIIQEVVLAHERRIHMFCANQYQTSFRKNDLNDLSKWWNRNRTQPLWQLQADAVKEQLEIMKMIDYASMEPRTSRSGQANISKQDFEKLKSENISSLENLYSWIVSLKEPLLPDTIDEPYGNMIGLPWFDGTK